MKLIIQPDEGIAPLVNAVRKAKRRVDILIFRFDRSELEKVLEAAVTRGVTVRALIAHTNRGGDKVLRKLELRLLDAGVSVARSADDLPRYHGKMMIVDDTLHVFGFNYTKLDIEKSRSFGIVTKDRRLVKEAAALFEADRTRQPYVPGHDRLVVSPESSRAILGAFIRKARKQLLIYDTKVSDRLMLRLLAERHPDRPLKTNVEFYAAPVLMGVGLSPDLFPATFSLSRHAGWTAHVLEQAASNRLIRPDVRYIGPAERDLPA